jgi:hypothetical protein
MKVLVQFYDKNGRELLGSDGAAIFSDLKTLKGVHRRLSHWPLRPSANSYKIFRTGHNFYDESAYTLLDAGHVAELRARR